MKKKIKRPFLPKTGCYERLSRQDEGRIESNSIANQRKKNEQYAVEKGFTNIVHYTDDGYSGTSFDRPAWKRLIEDVEKGKISVVVVKDMSRIGRNYLEVGYYTEMYFPQKRVRFIAINNNVD
ncbi:MAG: recombinase family protein, partial [Oscillospiraceae bacterium]|nr:recombinase family protein [Oscillospiraceae bacterium]